MTPVRATSQNGFDEIGGKRKRSGLWSFAPWLLTGLLLISNVAIVLNERIHGAAYDIVATIASIAGQVVADSVLSHSPTRAKAKVVNLETRRLQTEKVELIAKNRALQREHEIVLAGKAALAKEHEAMRAVAAKRATAVKAIVNRTTYVLTSRSAEAVSTLPVRAVPYVGIAALVTFTTWELKANCDLAKALAELNAEHGNESIDTGKVCSAVDRVPTPQQAWNEVKSQSSGALKATFDGVEAAAHRLGLTFHTEPLK